GLATAVLHRIGDGEQRQCLGSVGEDDHALALALQRIEAGLDGRRTQAELLQQAMVAQVVAVAIDAAAAAATRDGAEPLHLPECYRLACRLPGDGLGYRVVRALGEAGGNRL